jgi:acyl-coenzyme A thioesterase PaaI-like protein
VRETLNTTDTVRACIVFLRYLKPTKESLAAGETKERPFLELVALLDLGKGVNGYAGTAHGGFYGVVLDEVMGSAVKMQSGEHVFDPLSPESSLP